VKLGQRGEELAVKFLRKKGYRIISRNFKTPLGEIDIIARHNETIVFIEVKTRESIAFGRPFEAVNSTKKQKIANVAMLYLKKFKEHPPCRFDVVSIYYDRGKPEYELIMDAFEL
jgi:putative endonuclease